MGSAQYYIYGDAKKRRQSACSTILINGKHGPLPFIVSIVISKRQRYAPLQVGRSKLKYQVGGDCAEKALSAALRGLKAQQVQSPGQRPGYHVPIPYAL